MTHHVHDSNTTLRCRRAALSASQDRASSAPCAFSPLVRALAAAIALTPLMISAREINLADLGDRGFRILGAAAGDRAGRSVSGAGDINGDGLADLIVGAPFADATGIDSGASYVVFGREGAPGLQDVSLTDLGDRGFRIRGAAAGDRAGHSVSGAGDINGDGLGDLLVGAVNADANNFADSGASYVIFGRAGTTEEVNLDQLGDRGFRIRGAAIGDSTGRSVSGAGDVNGDGLADLIVGAPYADEIGFNSGASYVVLGRRVAEGLADVELASLGDRGFRLRGAAAGDLAGRDVSGAGDVNGDGMDDLIVGATFADANGTNSGASYVVFGRESAAGELDDVELANLGALGFRIVGAAASHFAGGSISGAGDVNGDGLADIIVGSPFVDVNDEHAGASYVVFGLGGAEGLEEVNLGDLGDRGFRIVGAAAAYDPLGFRVSGAGDVNGDGLADLIVGTPYPNVNGLAPGASYVVFGKAGAAEEVNLDQLGDRGFRMVGAAAYDFAGYSVSGAGDVNGDGLADLIVGASGADANGEDAGASYILFGTTNTPSASYQARQQTRGCRFEDKGSPLGIVGDGSNDDSPDARLWIDYCLAAGQDPQLAEPQVTLHRQAPRHDGAPAALANGHRPANFTWSLDFGLLPEVQAAVPLADVTLRYTDADIAGLDEAALWVHADPQIGGDGDFAAGLVTRHWPERNLIEVRLRTREAVHLALGAPPLTPEIFSDSFED